MTRRLLFFPDWTADPLWGLGPGMDGGAMVSLDQLPVSPSTRKAVRGWARRWEDVAGQEMHAEDVEAGMLAGPATPVPALVWDELWRDGRRVWAALQGELGPDWQVGWATFPGGVRHVQWTPDGDVEPCPVDRSTA